MRSRRRAVVVAGSLIVVAAQCLLLLLGSRPLASLSEAVPQLLVWGQRSSSWPPRGYRTLAEVEAFVEAASASSPHVRVVRSRGVDPALWRVVLAEDATARTLPAVRVLVSFGEHPRELFVVEAFVALVERLLRGDARAQHILRNAELHLIGVLNRSGRVHLEESGDECVRHTHPARVDVNRNFPWLFGGPSSGALRGDEEYRGEAPFSEPETRFVREVLLEEGGRDKPFDAVVSVHSGARQILVPFIDAQSKKLRRTRPQTPAELALVARLCSRVGRGRLFLQRDSGVGWQSNDYTADGTLMDWSAGVLNVSRALTVEIWGDGVEKESCFEQFNPAPGPALERALASATEFFEELFVALIEERQRNEL